MYDKFTNGKEYNNQFTQEELNSEVWKDVVGYEGLYKVSSLGRIKSLDRIVTHKNGRKRLFKGKLITPFKNEYFMVVLSKNGKKSSSNIHRLVAQAFIPNPDNLPEVNHIDEDKTNNRISNLEWCTSKYNINYGTRNERTAEAHNKPVVMYDKKGNKLKEFKSTMDASNYLNKQYAYNHINECCRGERKSAYGYVWKRK